MQYRPTAVTFFALIAQLLIGCNTTHQARNEVVVLGAIHGGHRTSEAYSLEALRAMIELIDPDIVLCEIPPDRVSIALSQFTNDGVITEPRVRVFPEYTDVLFPLHSELEFTIIGCAGWSQAMADDRREKMSRWATQRQAEMEEVSRAQDHADEMIKAEGLDDDLRGIHTPRYDELVRQGMEPYDRLFNDDLGLGGWSNINTAHYALIAAALDQHTGEGKRILIIFGAWHKYWFLDELSVRGDITVLDPLIFIADSP